MMRSIILGMALGCAAAGLPLVGNWERPIVINVSPSVPIGVYGRSRIGPGFGDYVLVRPPPAARALALARGYLPPGRFLIKRVASRPGDRVCRLGSRVSIGGHTRVWARRNDSVGRALLNWSGCHRLRPDQLFLLGPHANSFDSRYFGPVNMELVTSRVIAVWTF